MDRVVFVREPAMASALKKHWGWLVVLGVAEGIAGVAAIALPVAATFFATVVLSWVLVAAGAIHLMHSISVRRWRGTGVNAITGLLYLVTGALAIAFPLPSALSLALIVASLLVVDGISRSLFALRLRPTDGWGWLLAAGAASAALGVMLLSTWPTAGLWSLGLLLGVNLIFSGSMYVALGVNCREVRREESASWVAAH